MRPAAVGKVDPKATFGVVLPMTQNGKSADVRVAEVGWVE